MFDKTYEKIKKITYIELSKITQKMQEDIKKNLSEPSPPASNPGQPPHSENGDLANSIETTSNINNMSFSIGSSDPVAFYQEFGTKYIAPRPFFHPVTNKITKTLRIDLQTEIMRKYNQTP